MAALDDDDWDGEEGCEDDDDEDDEQSLATSSLPPSARSTLSSCRHTLGPPSHRAAPTAAFAAAALPATPTAATTEAAAAAALAASAASAAAAKSAKAGPNGAASHLELLPSIFPNRPPTIYFDRPPGLPERDSLQDTSAERMRVAIDTNGPRSLCMRIEKNANSVRHAFKRAGFTVNAAKEAVRPLVCWSRHSGDKLWTELPLGARVNHFPGSWTLGRKDGLSRILSDQQKRLGGTEYAFVPRTFTLPGERGALERALASGQLQGGGTFIVKPLNSSRGRGIFITSDLDELEPDAKLLVQEYLAHPFLLPQMPNKFDLRIYVLVASFEPLRAYTFEQGLARFATQPYAVPSADDLGERCAHLTNYSINKSDGDYIANADAEDDASGHKWSLAACFRALAETGVDVSALRKRIDAMLAKTLIAAQGHVTQKYAQLFKRRGCCFELFGFDVMLDEQVKPWLIEVNVSPDLASTSPLDRQLKGTLAADTLHLIGIQPSANLAAAANAVPPESPKPESPPLLGRLSHGNRHVRDLEGGGVPLSALTPTELRVLAESEEEWSRANATGFRRIYPPETASAQARLAKLFEQPRYADALVSAYLRRPNRVDELRDALEAAHPPEAAPVGPMPGLATAAQLRMGLGGAPALPPRALPPRPATAAALGSGSRGAVSAAGALRASSHAQRPRTAAALAASHGADTGAAPAHGLPQGPSHKAARRSSSSRSGARCAAARRSSSPAATGNGRAGMSGSPHRAKASSARSAALPRGGAVGGSFGHGVGGLSVTGAGLRQSMHATTPLPSTPIRKGQHGRVGASSAGGARPPPQRPIPQHQRAPNSAGRAGPPFATGGTLDSGSRAPHRTAPALPPGRV